VKDAVFAVDDYAPSPGNRQRLERDADRLLRAQGKRSGRQRMRADATLRPAKPPRGLILSTGEDVPPGHSLRGRLLVLEVSRGDVLLPGLTSHQSAAAAGLYAQAQAGFIRWLAPQYAELRERLPGRRAELRDRANAEGHARTPGIVADLALGLQLFLDFALASGAVTKEARDALARCSWGALLEAGRAHGRHVEAAEPTAHFLRLLGGALASGRAHVAGTDGGAPDNPGAWGWRGGEAQGRCVGWIDGDDLFLGPEAAYAEAQQLSRHQGDTLAVSSRTLWRRLKERGLLAAWDEARQRNTVRRTLAGVRDRDVLHLRPDALSGGDAPSEPSTNFADPPTPGEVRTVSADGSADGNGACGGNRPQETSANAGGSPPRGRFGRSAPAESPPRQENCAPSPTRRRGVL
jgi:hypothetical protein